jgi:hypothetical protein
MLPPMCNVLLIDGLALKELSVAPRMRLTIDQSAQSRLDVAVVNGIGFEDAHFDRNGLAGGKL